MCHHGSSDESDCKTGQSGILSRPAITRCYCPTEKETVWWRSCDRATCIVPRTGKKCFYQKSTASRNLVRKRYFGPMPRLAKPEIYEALEEPEVKCAIRLPANASLERDIEELLTGPVGRLSDKPIVWHKGFLYQAASWKAARRVGAKAEFHVGQLFPRMGFIVTNLETPTRAMVRFYNKRGTAEQWIKEGKPAVMTRLSCHRFRSNQVRLALSPLAYNLGKFVAAAGAARRIENWSLTSLQQRLVKTGGWLVKHARYSWFFLAEGHLDRRRFGAMLGRIARLPAPSG